MNIGLRKDRGPKSQIQQPSQPKHKRKATSAFTKKMARLWRSIWRKKRVLVDFTIFAAAAGAIYLFGEKITEAFVNQLPVEPAGKAAQGFAVPEL